MNESAAPQVDAPALTSVAPPAVGIVLDADAGCLTLDFGPHSWSGDDAALDELCEELSETLLEDDDVALQVRFCGDLLSAALMQKVLRCITQDCDRAVSSVAMSHDIGRHLLSDILHRPVEWSPTPRISRSVQPGRPQMPILALADSTSPDPQVPEGRSPPGDGLDGHHADVVEDRAVACVLADSTDTDSPEADSTETDSTETDSTEAETAALDPADLPVFEGTRAGEAGTVPTWLNAPASAPLAVEPEAVLTPQASPPDVALPDPVPTSTDSDSLAAFSGSVSVPANIRVDAEEVTDEDPSRARPWGDTLDGDRRVLALRRTLRSGAVVRFPGDVVLFGDLNAGAQVVAHGDIVVLGKLRGLAHAGARGDADALVIGLDMTAGQVRIADVIAFPQEEPEPAEAGSRLTRLLAKVQPTLPRTVAPTIARLVDGVICVEDYTGRLHA